MIWELFAALRRLCKRISSLPDWAEDEIRQDTGLAVILSVQCVDAFMNVYFRIAVEEQQFSHAKLRILRDLETRVGLEKKLNEWPMAVFGEKLNFGAGVGQRFKKFKALRDRLTHFSSDHQTFEHENVRVVGMVDTTEFDSLSKEIAVDALRTAEGFLCEVFAARGIPATNVKHALHQWTGKVPSGVTS